MEILRADAGQFFGQLVAQEMQRIKFNNVLVRLFLAQLILDFLQSTDEHQIFYPPAEDALVRILPGADWSKLETTGERLLFGIGFFPESFRARGKRVVDIGYYIGVEKAIAHRLGEWSERWGEVDRHFSRTVATIAGVRARTRGASVQIGKIVDDIEAIPPIKLF